MDTFGSIDFAVNNAGISTPDPAMDISENDFKKVIDVNLNGVFFYGPNSREGNEGSGKRRFYY